MPILLHFKSVVLSASIAKHATASAPILRLVPQEFRYPKDLSVADEQESPLVMVTECLSILRPWSLDYCRSLVLPGSPPFSAGAPLSIGGYQEGEGDLFSLFHVTTGFS